MTYCIGETVGPEAYCKRETVRPGTWILKLADCISETAGRLALKLGAWLPA